MEGSLNHLEGFLPSLNALNGLFTGESRRSKALQLLLIAFKTFTKWKLFNLSEAPFANIRDLLKLAIMQQVKREKEPQSKGN